MSERQRIGRPDGPEDQDTEEDGAPELDGIRELADQVMANAQSAMRRLGLDSAEAFMNATRQTGGQ